MTRTIVAIESQQLSAAVCTALERGGIQVRTRCRTGAEAIRAVKRMGGGVVVCSFRLPDMTANELRGCLGSGASILVVAKPQELSLCEGEDTFRLAIPVKAGELTGSVNMLLQLDNMRAAPKRAPEDRALIDKAKALLMENDGMSEPAAHKYLQSKSMAACRPMTETAKLVIASFESENI